MAGHERLERPRAFWRFFELIFLFDKKTKHFG